MATQYIVQKGDTLSGIAKKQGIADWQTLYQLNKGVVGSDPNKIYPGQVLQLPTAPTTPTPTTPTVPVTPPAPTGGTTPPLVVSPPTAPPSGNLENIQKGIAEVAAKTQALAAGVQQEGITTPEQELRQYGDPSALWAQSGLASTGPYHPTRTGELLAWAKANLKAKTPAETSQYFTFYDASGKPHQYFGGQSKANEWASAMGYTATPGEGGEAPPAPPVDTGEGGDEVVDNLNDVLLKFQTSGSDSYVKSIDDWQKAIGGGAIKPTAPSYAAEYETFRQKYGVGDVESQLTTIEAELNDLTMQEQAAIGQESERLAPTALIRLRQTKLGKDFDRIKQTKLLEKQTLVNQLNQKYAIVNQMMSFSKMSYDDAKQTYQFNYQNAFNLFQLGLGQQDKAKASAQANLKVVMDMVSEGLKSGSFTADQIPASSLLALRDLEQQAGYPAGISEALIKVIKPEKTIKFSVVSDDKMQATIFYTDGTSDIFDTGLKAPATGAGGDFTDQEKRKLEAAGLSNASRDEQLKYLYPKSETKTISQATLNKLALAGVPNDVAIDIQGYLNAGYTEAQIKQGLKNYGRDPGLYDKFAAEMKKAGEMILVQP